MWSGSWHLCNAAVEAVLRGAPITEMPAEAADSKNAPPFKAYDIRHVNRECKLAVAASPDLHRVRNRCRFKRSGGKPLRPRESVCSADDSSREEGNGSPSHESSLSHQSEGGAASAAPALDSVKDERGDELELTLGLEPLSRCMKPAHKRGVSLAAGFGVMELRLDCPAS